MQPNQQKYWFPAKRYGWGWGLPCAWQGWVVMVVWLGLGVGGAILFGPHLEIYIPYVLILAGALFAILWIKGERPHWRWGGD
ncbi:MAG: hypothetical protein ABSG59_09740 [Verrucomicrobiota bacterium]|jgi:hypothetical protein